MAARAALRGAPFLWPHSGGAAGMIRVVYDNALTGQSVPIPRGCRRDLTDAHQAHFAQAGCGLQEIFGPTHGLPPKS